MIFLVFSLQKDRIETTLFSGQEVWCLSAFSGCGTWSLEPSRGAEGRRCKVLFGNLIGAYSDLIWRAKSCIQKFRQVPSMDGFLKLIFRLFWGWETSPYIGRTNTAYIKARIPPFWVPEIRVTKWRTASIEVFRTKHKSGAFEKLGKDMKLFTLLVTNIFPSKALLSR